MAVIDSKVAATLLGGSEGVQAEAEHGLHLDPSQVAHGPAHPVACFDQLQSRAPPKTASEEDTSKRQPGQEPESC